MGERSMQKLWFFSVYCFAAVACGTFDPGNDGLVLPEGTWTGFYTIFENQCGVESKTLATSMVLSRSSRDGFRLTDEEGHVYHCRSEVTSSVCDAVVLLREPSPVVGGMVTIEVSESVTFFLPSLTSINGDATVDMVCEGALCSEFEVATLPCSYAKTLVLSFVGR